MSMRLGRFATLPALVLTLACHADQSAQSLGAALEPAQLSVTPATLQLGELVGGVPVETGLTIRTRSGLSQLVQVSIAGGFSGSSPILSVPPDSTLFVPLTVRALETGAVEGTVTLHAAHGVQVVPILARVTGFCAPASSCDDGNPCTRDSCDPATGCVHTASPPMPSDASCRISVCDAAGGWRSEVAPDGTPCGESSCTNARVCRSGACLEEPAGDGDGCLIGSDTPCPVAGTCVASSCVPSDRPRLEPLWRYEAPRDGSLVFSGVVDADGNSYALECNVCTCEERCRFTASVQCDACRATCQGREDICQLLSLDANGTQRFRLPIESVAIGLHMVTGNELVTVERGHLVQGRSRTDGIVVWEFDADAALRAHVPTASDTRVDSIALADGAFYLTLSASMPAGKYSSDRSWLARFRPGESDFELLGPEEPYWSMSITGIGGDGRLVLALSPGSCEPAYVIRASDGAPSAFLSACSQYCADYDYVPIGNHAWAAAYSRPRAAVDASGAAVQLDFRGGPVGFDEALIAPARRMEDCTVHVDPDCGHCGAPLSPAPGHRPAGPESLLRLDTETREVQWEVPVEGARELILTDRASVLLTSDLDRAAGTRQLEEIGVDGSRRYACELPAREFGTPALAAGRWIVPVYTRHEDGRRLTSAIEAYRIPGARESPRGWVGEAGGSTRERRFR